MVDANLEDEDETTDGEAAEGEGGEASEEGGGNKKMLIIIIAVVILLLGGGAGAYFSGLLDPYLGGGETAEDSEHGDEHAEAGHEDASHGSGDSHAGDDGHGGGDSHGGDDGHGGSVFSGGPVFLKVPDQRVNLNSIDGSNAFLQLSIQLELKNQSDRARVEAVMPRVIDQFQTYLRELRVEDLRGSQGVQRLAVELLIRVNQAAAPVEVQDVLFGEILIQEN